VAYSDKTKQNKIKNIKKYKKDVDIGKLSAYDGNQKQIVEKEEQKQGGCKWRAPKRELTG
jgi:hypothetical protein